MTQEKRGFIELLFATFFFSLFGVFTRVLSEEIGIFFQLFIRTAIMTLMFYGIAGWAKLLQPVKKRDLPVLLLRGVLIVTDFYCFYFAVTHMPLGVTMFLFYAVNVITSFVFGAVILKEQFTRVKAVSLLLAILGLYIMNSDSVTAIELLPFLAISVSGICFGLTTTTSKLVSQRYDSLHINLIGYGTAALFVFPLLLWSGEPITLFLPFSTWMTLIGFSIVGVLAFYLVLDGFKYVEAQKGSIIMLAELLFVTILGYILYTEIPSPMTIIGGVCILTALLLPNIQWKKHT